MSGFWCDIRYTIVENICKHMPSSSTLVFLMTWILGSLSVGSSVFAAGASDPVRVKPPPEMSELTPYSLFFPPQKNGVIMERQKIDYDLSQQNILRMGPYVLAEDAVSMQMSREQGEFFEIDFGIEVRRKLGPVYVLSFRWPKDYIDGGIIEIIGDKNEIYWRRPVTPSDMQEWDNLLNEQKTLTPEDVLKMKKDNKASQAQQKFGLTRAQGLGKLHGRSSFGLAYRGFYEFPIAQIKAPFRFCISQEDGDGRVAACSRRYKFTRRFGRYSLETVSSNVRPRVMVNDKSVTLKGTAIFLDYETPVKFSALLGNGTYYEFISRPKAINVVDMIFDKQQDRIEVVGYGDQPMGQVEDSFFADSVHWGFLNFMPTIGDLRQFWRATISARAPYLYIKGKGGAPFRQTFTFDALPTKEARMTLDSQTQRTTYNGRAYLDGHVASNLKLASPDSHVEKTDDRDFEWTFLAPQKGVYNTADLNVFQDDHKWTGEYRIFRGFPAEISARMTGIISNDLDLILLGEVAGQYWFEKAFWLDNYYISKLRWGIAVKYFQTLLFAKDDPENQGITGLNVTNVDLKYRLSPGIWGRDPSVGLIFAYEQVSYEFRKYSVDYKSDNSLVGGGAFWARSMPRIFDRLFNIIPFFRYPKWVDMEFIYYPVALDTEKTANVNVAFNFHGKVQWTDRFYGEGGFGLKTFSYSDPSINKNIGFGLAYGTVGLGFNF